MDKKPRYSELEVLIVERDKSIADCKRELAEAIRLCVRLNELYTEQLALVKFMAKTVEEL